MPLTIILRAVQYDNTTKKSEILLIWTLIVFNNELIDHVCQHSFDDAHKETF